MQMMESVQRARGRMDGWFDIVKLKYGYYVYGYVACLGGPYQTIEQAEKRRDYVLAKWKGELESWSKQ